MTLDDQERKRIVQAIRAYIARERISREEFAQRAKLGKSTVDKLVVGIFSEKTILQIESQMKLSLLGGAGAAAVEAAGEEFGRYTKDDIKDYIGKYVFARPSFRENGVICAFPMEIVWDSDTPGLLVREITEGRKDAAQFGKVYIPRASAHIFIVSNEAAWMKEVILTRIDVYKRMKGVMLTMGHAFANIYIPVAMPVIMNKYEKIETGMTGDIDAKAAIHKEYMRDLMAVEDDRFAKWIRLNKN
jgi:hypothetical protein